MLIEHRTVSRKTPVDGKLEISEAAAHQLAALGASFPLRTARGESRGKLIEMTCTCAKAATSGQHRHHFVESDALRALEPDSEVRVEIDDAHPGALSIR